MTATRRPDVYGRSVPKFISVQGFRLDSSFRTGLLRPVDHIVRGRRTPSRNRPVFDRGLRCPVLGCLGERNAFQECSENSLEQRFVHATLGAGRVPQRDSLSATNAQNGHGEGSLEETGIAFLFGALPLGRFVSSPTNVEHNKH